MSDIKKWYMRLLLMLLTGPVGLIIIIVCAFDIAVTLKDVAPVPFQIGSLEQIPGFWFYAYLLMVLSFIGPLILPRLFAPISVGLNSFGIWLLIKMTWNEPNIGMYFSGEWNPKNPDRALDAFGNEIPLNFDGLFAGITGIVICILSIILLIPSIRYLYQNNLLKKG